ncbi:aminoglycoside phosphotransferase family protein [Solimicrobium silvestre]|uniref:Putative phosphotransferase related to Ser/Thr protein kinase n=1 Tax=Solimicrobium silvestre TaxID=2099400 RepID=A0A2S9GT83_9BURK|nr:phosphotransferase [Solimicrobium silvestre]PRC90932.1 putative phosphotransferase related to Ser/Thr protein kinase [Solimicrobium silvestre]
MSIRDLERRRFISAAGIAPSPCIALAADASSRCYFRLPNAQPAQLLMDMEPDSPDLSAYILISHYLNNIGLSAPRVLRSNSATGLTLIDDFGTQTYTSALANGHDETTLYELAVDALVTLHSAQHVPHELPTYDMAALISEVELFLHWYLPELKQGATKFGQQFIQRWQEALSDVAQRRDALVLRDYHVDNLMIIPERIGTAACGLLDFQDALIGSRAYDLMSLCQDARRDLSDGLEQHLITRYLNAMPEINHPQFLSDYWLLAAQRHTKVAGIFERLARRDGKYQYLRHQPRVVRLLRQALEQANLQAITNLLDQHFPHWEIVGLPIKQSA